MAKTEDGEENKTKMEEDPAGGIPLYGTSLNHRILEITCYMCQVLCFFGLNTQNPFVLLLLQS